MKISTAMIVIGIVLGLFGLLALANPFAASLAVTSLVGIAFLASGVILAWLLFNAGEHDGRLSNGLVALLSLVAGVWLLANPLAGTVSLTLLLGVIFFALGIVRLAMAMSARGTPVFWLILLSGLFSVLIGVLVFSDFASAATSFLGILLGIELVSEGAGLFAFGLIARRNGA